MPIQLAGYQVQRCLVPAGQPTCVPQDLAGATTASTTFTDTPPQLGVYQYAVVALCTQCPWGRSLPSNILTVTLGTPPVPPPSAVRADTLLPPARLLATADSQETRATPAAPAALVLDGQANTLWHSQYTPTLAPLPHWLRLDLQGGLWWTSGLTVLPRQDLSANGMIKDYRVEGSPDGVTWTTLASGTWPATRAPQTVRWAAVLTQAVRLVVLSNQQNQCCYASASEVAILGASQP